MGDAGDDGNVFHPRRVVAPARAWGSRRGGGAGLGGNLGLRHGRIVRPGEPLALLERPGLTRRSGALVGRDPAGTALVLCRSVWPAWYPPDVIANIIVQSP